MVKTHNRIIAGVISVLLIGQAAMFGDGTGHGILHPDTISLAAESIKEMKHEKELAKDFEQVASELGQVDYFDVSDLKTGSKSLKKSQKRSAESDPMDDVSDSLTVSGNVLLGEVSGHSRNDDPPIYIRIFTGDWQELTHQTIHNGDPYCVSIEGGYSDVYHVKYECDGYLPFYLKDYGTGSFVVGSNGSHNTITLVPGDTTYNANDNNQWSDDNLNFDDNQYVSSCINAVRGASDYLDWLDYDGDGEISQDDVNAVQDMYINMGDESIDVPSDASLYDLNNDGVINFNDSIDFANYLDNVTAILSGIWDINGDGSINADDYTAYCDFFENQENSDAINLYNMDLNHDGSVNADDQEGIEYYANLPKRSENYHDYMDKNNNGVIDSYDVSWFESAYSGDLDWDRAFKKYIRLEEGAYFPYSYNLHDTDLDLNGHTLAVNEYMSFNTDIPQFWSNGIAANLDVNGGFMYVGKNLVFRTASPDGWSSKPGQTLYINGGTVYVGECFDFGQAHCNDQIIMTNDSDNFTICGKWTYVTDADMEGKWTAGQIHFYGDHWNVNEDSGDKSIYSSGTHSIEFLNPNGLQTILWANKETFLDDNGNTQTGRRFNFDYVDDNGNCLGVIFPYGYSPELYWFRPWFRTNEEELTAYRKAWEGPDGVHAATGNYKKSFEDYSVTTPGVGTDFVRSYNSTNPEEGSFGVGWDFNIDVSKIITNSYSNYIQVVLPDGSNTTFEKLGANNFRCVNAHSTIEEVQVGNQYEYTVTNIAQSQYHFNINGELDWIKDANGNKLLISSIENNKRTITDSINRKYYIYYTGNADHRRITKIEDVSAHKEVTYEYDNNDRLIASTNVKGGKESYFYDKNGKLNRIENCFGETTLNVTYIDNGRVENTVNEHGLKQVYVYDKENCQTGMEEYEGSKLLKKVTYEYDEDYAIVANHTIVDGTEYTDRTEYYKNSEGKNKYDEIKKATDVSGNTTEYEYDSNGNITKVINPDGTFTVTSYNDKNMPLVEVDEMKNVTIYEYDSNGVNVKRKGNSIHPVNDAYALTSDNSFSFNSVNLDDYAVTEYDYYELTIDESTRLAGLIRATTDPEGNITENTYNSNGLVASTVVKDRNGNICSKKTFDYTDSLQPSEVKEIVNYNADSSENTTRTTYEYDNFNNITQIITYGTGNDGIIVSYDYDVLGRKIAEYTPKYAVDKSVGSTYTFNRGNLPSTVTDTLGNVTTFKYDAYGNLVKTTNPDGSISITEYDALQREKATYFQESASSPKQIISKNEYEYVDSDFTVYSDLEISETRHLYGLKERSYAYITADKQVITETVQDFRGNTVSESVNKVLKRTCNYYANGELARQIDACGNVTKYEYGFLGALTKTYTPFYKDENDDNITKYAVSEVQYDKTGNVIKTIDPINEQGDSTTKNSITESKYDGVGNLIEVKMTDSDTNSVNITRYEYDMIGNVIKQYTGIASDNDNDYVLTEFEYDQYLRPISSHDSTGYISGTTEYDINGNIIRSTDPNGNITVNTYDNLDRLVKSVKTNSNDSSSITASYQFDKLGRTIRSSVGKATTTYEYDKLGRVISETDSNGTFKGYFYEGISDYVSRAITGQRHLLIYSDVTYQYDAEMRVSSISESGSQIVSYEYDANGNKSKETLANGISTEYAYNCINAVTEIKSFNGTNEIASTKYRYYLDGSNSIKTVTENDITETTSYVYNGFGQLTEEKIENGSLTDKYNYSYDDYGNRVRMTATGSAVFTTVYNYKNAQNQYTALLQNETKTGINDETDTEETEITAYTYDKNGNQLSKISNEKTEHFTYNVLDQLVGYTDGETTASYVYDADGLRASKTVNGHTIKHVWDGNQNIIADIIDDAPYTANCYFFGTGITASYTFSSGIKSDYNYYRKNAHGDVVSITNAAANNIKTYRYDAFGVEKNIDESDTNAFRYCGEYYDTETETIYLRARYYAPSIGRFITRDSFGGSADDPLSLNRYTYCHNNPIFYTDPTGHSAWSDFKKGVKQWGKDRVDDWKTGIGILEDSGPAGQVFASYSHGVVDTLGSHISAVTHPKQTAKALVNNVKSFVNDPVGSIKSSAMEKYNSVCSVIKDVHNGNWQSLANKAAYSLGGASVVVVEAAICQAAAAKAPAVLNNIKCSITGKGCFVAGTLVATISGDKAIETIEVGDKVLSTDPETGETVYKEVLKTYTYVKDTLVYIEANGETIETTKEHPFWVEGQGWTKAKFLNDGDLLRDANGNSILITKVDIVPLPENQYTIVYNLEVEDFHTYYVSNKYILVHNVCHKMSGSVYRNGNKLPDLGGDYVSGGTKGRRLNFQEQLDTHTEAKFLKDINGKVDAGDHLLMRGELDPCRPGCQPKIRKFVLENDVTAEYFSNKSHFSWVKETDSSVLQTVTRNGNSITRRYTRNTKGKWSSRKI